MKKLYLLSFLLAPTLAYASGFSSGADTISDFFLGILLGILITVSLKTKILIKVILFLPITILSVFLSLSIGEAMYRYNMRKQYEYQQQNQLQYNTPPEVISPIKNAICDKNVEKVKNILSQPLDYSTNEQMGKFLINCSAKGMNNEITLRVMTYLHSEEHISFKNKYPDMIGYCEVLNDFHKHYKLDLLRTLMNAKLPIVCNENQEIISLNYYGNSYLTAEDEPKVYEWLKLLVESKNFKDKKNLDISDLVEVGSGRIILLTLELGDFYKKPNNYSRSPNEVWTERMFKYCDTCGLGFLGTRLSKEEIDTINKKVRPMTTEEINKTFILAHVQRFKDYPDTGAAFFNYLVKKGAKLNISYYYSTGSLAEHERLAPEFVAVLNKLTKEQIEELAYPRVIRDGVITSQFATPLLESAKLKNNKELIEFLCSHNIKGC
jgi:hypothetical protein